MLVSKHHHLTDELLAKVNPPKSGELRIWDNAFKGFLARVWPSGKVSFCVRYRRGNTAELYTIGTFLSPWTADQARVKASDVFLRFADSQKPARERRTGQAHTVNDIIERYLTEGPLMKVGKRASSWKTDATNLNRHVRPLIGKRIAADMKRSDVARLLKDITDGLTAGDFKTRKQGLARVRGGESCASRTLTTFRAMLNWAIAQDLLVTNPAKGLSLPKAPPMERFLSEEEATRLFRALSTAEQCGDLNLQHGNLIRLLLLTGARKSEIMGLRWDELDLKRNRLVLPATRTKSGRHNGTRRIPLRADPERS